MLTACGQVHNETNDVRKKFACVQTDKGDGLIVTYRLTNHGEQDTITNAIWLGWIPWIGVMIATGSMEISLNEVMTMVHTDTKCDPDKNKE